MRIPRLNRRWRIVRNLIAAAVLAVLLWAYAGFPPPAEGLALKWEAESYFTEPGEIVLQVAGEEPEESPIEFWLTRHSFDELILTHRNGYLLAYDHRWRIFHDASFEDVFPIVDGRCRVETGDDAYVGTYPVTVAGQPVTVEIVMREVEW